MIREYTGMRTFHGCIALALATVISVFAQPAAPSYDLLLRGGHVLDDKNHIDGVMDVAIKDGKIARVATHIPSDAALKTIDVKGLYVTPGLIDIHVHVYAGTGEREFLCGRPQRPSRWLYFPRWGHHRGRCGLLRLAKL